jgi:hypothetical protein
MRGKFIWLMGCGLGLAGFWALSWSQSLTADKQIPTVGPPRGESTIPGAEFAKLPLIDKQAYLSGRRGTDWLLRANRPDGRFLHGYLPALRAPMEGDHYLRQIEAACALARAGTFYKDDRATAVARQALLTLLLETTVDARNPEIRHPALPSVLVNRIAAAGMLVVAVHELPAPGSDLLAQAQQLCQYVRLKQRHDGSLDVLDSTVKASDGVRDAVEMQYSGPALNALALSQEHRPATWQVDSVRKARDYYLARWKAHKNMDMIPWHTAAYAEAYLATKDQSFADAVFVMNDWLCERQYQQLTPGHPRWLGGFKTWRDGKEIMDAPGAGSALFGESLVQACRVSRQTGDVRRWQRYRQAAQLCVQFVGTLQYTEANTQHFADWYRSILVGGSHGSHEDGNLRLDYSARTVSFFVQYLKHGTEKQDAASLAKE